MTQLFNLIEKERSPFMIARKSKVAVDALIKEHPEYEVFRESITRNLSLRIIQTCKNFFTNIKLSKLLTLLPFNSTEVEVERLVFEFNR